MIYIPQKKRPGLTPEGSEGGGVVTRSSAEDARDIKEIIKLYENVNEMNAQFDAHFARLHQQVAELSLKGVDATPFLSLKRVDATLIKQVLQSPRAEMTQGLANLLEMSAPTSLIGASSGQVGLSTVSKIPQLMEEMFQLVNELSVLMDKKGNCQEKEISLNVKKILDTLVV
jgi:hypothetical protein